MSLPSSSALAALVIVGFVAGLLNVIAGGGSLLTLPLLIFLGLPPGVANGTNRVAILLQNVVATWGFRRHGLHDTKLLRLSMPAAIAGGLLGAAAAVALGDRTFQRLLAWIMVAVVLWSLFGRRRLEQRAAARESRGRLWLAVGFFVVGLYGGFVQAGVGFLILAVLQLAGVDLVRGNAVKVVVVLAFTVVSLALFAFSGKVLWAHGLALAVGNSLGGLAGVHVSVAKGEVWIERVVLIAVLAFALRLWMSA